MKPKPKEKIETPSPQWLRPDEIAARLRVNETTIRRNIHTGPGPIPDGKIPGIRIGRQLRVHAEDLARFEARDLQSQQPMPTPTQRRFTYKIRGGRRSRFADL